MQQRSTGSACEFSTICHRLPYLHTFERWLLPVEVRPLGERVRDLERLLGRKTMEVEILKEALARSESKKPSLRLLSQPRDGSR